MDRQPTTTPTDTLPAAVYSAAQVRELDRVAIDRFGIDGYELMCRAGQGALGVLQRRWPRARRLTVYCGAGNNAGDGYVLARLAFRAGYEVQVTAVVAPQRLRGDAARAWADCRDAGVAISPFSDDPSTDASLTDASLTASHAPGSPFADEVIADALLGTGADRPLEGAFAAAVERINHAGMPVLALDVPSGLHADNGHVLGVAVRADATATFVGLKQGLFLGVAPDHRGVLEHFDLGVPADASAHLIPVLERLTLQRLHASLPPRPRSAHKGAHGRLLLVGGGPGMSGAIRLAAEAALRAGAGLVYVATHPDSRVAVGSGRPEVICHAAAGPAVLEPLLELADAVVLGPGLGTDDWGRGLFERVLACHLPLVVDADALNLLAGGTTERGNWILTPHPGEAARLMTCGVAEIQADRRLAVTTLARRYRATVVLKGACTLIAPAVHGDEGDPLPFVCDRGNPGMGSAGMGDVLAGVLGALLVQLRDLPGAACAGVLVHALAGDDAAAAGERGTLARDLMPYIRRWVNPR